MPSYTRLKGINDISESTLCDQLESNLMTFFNWGMLCIGAFGSVDLGASGVYGGDMSRLRAVTDPNYQNGTGFGKHFDRIGSGKVVLSTQFSQLKFPVCM
jgi:hypothetical protein